MKGKQNSAPIHSPCLLEPCLMLLFTSHRPPMAGRFPPRPCKVPVPAPASASVSLASRTQTPARKIVVAPACEAVLVGSSPQNLADGLGLGAAQLSNRSDHQEHSRRYSVSADCTAVRNGLRDCSAAMVGLRCSWGLANLAVLSTALQRRLAELSGSHSDAKKETSDYACA